MTIQSAMALAVLASGEGTTLQSILDHIERGQLTACVRLVVSDRPDAIALERARRAGVPVRVVSPLAYGNREAWTAALTLVLQQAQVELIVLAGFMRIVGTGLTAAFPGRILNIHPSLLPKYRGLNTYQRALASGEPEHGSSVHFVTPELDGGPVIAQVALDISRNDNEDSLRRRVQAQERWLYPEVIGWFADGRLAMRNDSVILDGVPLRAPVRLLPREAGQSNPALVGA